MITAMLRHLVPTFLVFVALATALAGAETLRPNVIYVFTDQQFAGAMSCVGNRDLRTPAMDSLAETGKRFIRAYCTHPLCSPSRASMLTGRMPHEVGVTGNNKEIASAFREQELGWLFRRAGYDCAYAGKWHLPDYNEPAEGHGFEILCNLNDRLVAQKGAEFIQRKRDKPFLLVAALHEPHGICSLKYQERPLELKIFSSRPGDTVEQFTQLCPPVPDNFVVPTGEPAFVGMYRLRYHGKKGPGTKDWKEDQWRHYLWAYYRLIEGVDQHLGQLLAALRESGQVEDTLVIFSSDHGDGAAAHRWTGKELFYEESIRIPLLISYPGCEKAGEVDEAHLVSIGLDLLPTVCDYAGIALPANLKGRSLRPLVEGRHVNDWREALVIQSRHGRAIVTNRYKYAIYASGTDPEQLIDLQADPGEMANLARDPGSRAVLDEHRDLLRRWCRENGDNCPTASDSE